MKPQTFLLESSVQHGNKMKGAVQEESIQYI